MNLPVTLLIVFWGIFILYWGISALFAKRYAHRGTSGILMRFAIVIVVLLLFRFTSLETLVVQAQDYLLFPAIHWLGVALCACGISFAIWARIYLGRNWGMPMSLKQDAELVTTGPYAYVRHPIYTGMILAVFGTALVVVWWAIAFVIVVGYFTWAGKREEKIMLNEFPNSYPDYMKRTKMLIPFVF
jgi:protein-S-isoprenylcysteine O-methyltransferase Ste14